MPAAPRGPQGALCTARVSGKCVSLYRWLDGQVVRPDRLTIPRLENVGRALADLHLIGKSYKKGIENRFTYDRVAQLYADVRDRLPPYFRKIVRTLDDEVEYLEHYLENKLPKGIIHGDLFNDNLLFKGDKLVAISTSRPRAAASSSSTSPPR